MDDFLGSVGGSGGGGGGSGRSASSSSSSTSGNNFASGFANGGGLTPLGVIALGVVAVLGLLTLVFLTRK